jgi:hypothetical protein
MLFACFGKHSLANNNSVVPFRLLNGFAVIVPVSINGSGPYDFLLDTGSTCTSVDRELAHSQGLTLRGDGNVITLVHRVPVSLALARTISIGPVTEPNVEVLVRDLRGLGATGQSIRGVLGQNALKQADFLLDYEHKTLRFDQTGNLLMLLKGERIHLIRIPQADDGQYMNLAVQAHIVGGGVSSNTELMLDSASGSLVIFKRRGDIAWRVDEGAAPRGTVADVTGQKQVVELQSMQLKIGARRLQVTADILDFSETSQDVGGLLPTYLFSSVYVSNSEGFVVFDPKIARWHSSNFFARSGRTARNPYGR